MNLSDQSTHIAIKKYISDYAIKISLAKREELFRATSLPYERMYLVMLKKTFSEQLEEIIDNLQSYKSKALEDVLIDWTKYRIIYNEFGQLMLPDIMSNWGNQELEALEVGISFDVENPFVRDAILTRSNRFADTVVNTTRDWLHVVLADSISQGEGPYQFEKKLRKLYPEMSKYRSTRIARTETIWAQNEGAELSYIQSGVVSEKRWLTAFDERTCPFCMAMDGKHIPVGTNFFDIGESLTVPNPKKYIIVQTKSGSYHFEISFKASEFLTLTFNYEQIRHPGLHPHCRCTIIPIVSDGNKAYAWFGIWLRIL